MTVTLRIASPEDLPLLMPLAAAANDGPYPLEPMLEEKCFGAGIAGRPVTTIAELSGEPAGFSVVCGRSLRVLAVDRRHRRHGVGKGLLGDAESRIAASGTNRVVIAAEAGNYFTPGVWAEDRGSRAFLESQGYSPSAETDNLLADLRDLPSLPADAVRRAIPEERDDVLAFIEREFGRIWRFEATPAFDASPPNAFIATVDGTFAGFAVHESNNRGLGTFGPTGVARPMRGRGLGRDLLLASLAGLHRLGYDQAVIPWTDALEFYRKSCGAKPAYHFVTYEKGLSRNR
jgi:GNAT superfamily N-acetyltransferase